jgi:pimeloyl-ACP methyl ester carboxylesterase
MTSTAFGATKTAIVNGTTLAYREQGQGEPVVFVHGSLSDMRVWEQQLPGVGRSYRAITYSRRYARPNEDIAPGVDDQMLPHVEDLAVFLREINAAPAHLVGNSWGAFISLLTAIRYPELVRTLVLEEPPVISLLAKSTPPGTLDMLRLLATRPRTALSLLRIVVSVFAPVQKAFREGDDEKALLLFFQGAGGKEAYEQTPEARIQIARENVAALKAQLLGAGFPRLADDEVRGVRPPVLLMTGENSPEFLLRLTDRLEELLPHPERVQISNASHAMHEENPQAVNEAILGFIGRHRERPISPPLPS